MDRVHALNGQVLLLGVDHSSDRTIHFAEVLAGVAYRRAKYTTLRLNGQVQRVEACDSYFKA